MPSKSGFTTLQVILLIDVIIVASAAAGYFYVSSLPAPALSSSQVQLSGLQVTPPTAFVDESIKVSVNVTNISGETGSYFVNLLLDGDPIEGQTIILAGGETKPVEFTVTDAGEGTHVVGIDNMQATFILTGKIELTNLAVNRTEVQIGEPVGITAKITNIAQSPESYSFTLSINGASVQTLTGQLNAGESTNILFEVVEQSLGTYNFAVGGQEGTFTVSQAAEPPKPAEFLVTNLSTDPGVTQPGITVTISAEVTNVGETSGSYTAGLTVNGQTRGTTTVELSGGETTVVSFTVTENVKGTYNVAIGNATGSFTIQDPAKIELTNFVISPVEVWGGETVTVSARAANTGSSVASLEVKLKVDNEVVATRTIALAPQSFISVSLTAVAPELPAGDLLSHTVDFNGIRGSFSVVKDGFHTLAVDISPSGDADFTITTPTGAVEQRTTPYSALLPVGRYTVTMPAADPTGKATFLHWEDKSTALSKSFTLSAKTTVIAVYSRASSCPSLYMWNGTENIYVGDISNHGWLGYINYLNEDGSISYFRNHPWDFVPLNSSQLQETNGNYNLTLIQRWNEVFYLDQAYMMVVDHAPDVDVYSTMVEQYLDPNYMGKIYTVSKNSVTPVTATDQNGENLLSQISKVDGVFTSGTNGIQSPQWNNITWNRLTLNLGNLEAAKQIKLVVRAIVDWGLADDYTIWLDKFFAQPVPDGTQITPPPYMEVKDVNGNWVSVPESRSFPLPPDGVARTYVIDLTGLFPTNDYSLRINNFWNVTFDYIAVDTSLQQNTIIQKIDPQANLYQAFTADADAATGNFTKYGNVTQLLLSEDDMFVIGRQGEAVSLQFSTDKLDPPATGMVRDYFFYDACWFKDPTGNWGFGFGFTADPLPFKDMTGFPYPINEQYPNDVAHQNYQQQWNKRIIQP